MVISSTGRSLDGVDICWEAPAAALSWKILLRGITMDSKSWVKQTIT
jgi:hypothetical protein